MDDNTEPAGGQVGGEAGRSGYGVSFDDWPDDDEAEAVPRRQPASSRDAGSSAAPPARGGGQKRRAAQGLFGSRTKKPRGGAAATRREESAAKAARFRKVVKQPQTVSAAPLSLDRAAAGSVVESPRGSGSTTRHVDPRADLQAATERNAWEAREEREAREEEAWKAAAAQAAQEEEAAKARADAAARAQAEAAAAAAAEEVLMVTPLRVMAPGDMEPSPEGASGGQAGLGRDDDVIILERAPVPTPPTGAAQGGRPEPPPAQSAGGEPAVRTEVAVRMLPSRRAGKAALEPQKAASEPQPAAGSSSSARDAGAAVTPKFSFGFFKRFYLT